MSKKYLLVIVAFAAIVIGVRRSNTITSAIRNSRVSPREWNDSLTSIPSRSPGQKLLMV